MSHLQKQRTHSHEYALCQQAALPNAERLSDSDEVSGCDGVTRGWHELTEAVGAHLIRGTVDMNNKLTITGFTVVNVLGRKDCRIVAALFVEDLVHDSLLVARMGEDTP